MSGELYPDESPDPEDFFVSALAPLMRAGTERKTDDPYPFALVQFITGSDNPDEGTADGVVQVDYLDVARDGRLAAQNAKLSARQGHRLLTYVGRHASNVLLSDSRWANADYVSTSMSPHRMDYPDDLVVRYTARYNAGFSFVAAD